MKVRRLIAFTSPGIVVTVLICTTCVQYGSSTMILGSMLMAANTAMLLGKMSLGGLMMMMLTQNSGSGGGSGGTGGLSSLVSSLANIGQGRKRSTESASNTNANTVLGLNLANLASTSSKRTTRSNTGEKIRSTSTATSLPHSSTSGYKYYGSGRGQDHSYRFIAGQVPLGVVPVSVPAPQPQQQYRHARYRRSVTATETSENLAPDQVNDTVNTNISEAQSSNGSSPPTNTTNSVSDTSASNSTGDGEATTEQLLTYRRLMRQADSFDYMSCLPKFVCGLEAQPPSKRTSILNDYSHLLKLLFAPDNDDDDDELDDEIELPSDEVDAENIEEYRKLLEKQELLDDTIHDRIMEEEPSMLKYVLKDVAKAGLRRAGLGLTKDKTKGKDKDDKSPSKRRKIPTTGKKDKDDSVKTKYGFVSGKPPGFPHRHPGRLPRPPGYPPKQQPTSSSGFLSSLLPKVEVGFGSKSDDPDFTKDPFFSGFKRSLDMIPTSAGANDINVNEAGADNGEGNKRSKRISEPHRRRRRREAVEELLQEDPILKKYQEAREIGRQSRQRGNKGQDCSKTFKKCPYEWSQIMGMISNMRNTLTPSNGTQSQQEKIVVLQVPNPGVPSQSGVVTAYTKHGETKMTQDLGNGNIMQITMKLTPKVTGFESTPIVQQEPYPDSDELSLESLSLLPIHKPSLAPTSHKQKAPTTTNKDKEFDIDESEEEQVEEVVKRIQAKPSGTRKQKPKRTYRPSPNVNFAFADDIDIAGVKGATILPVGGSDTEVKLRVSKQNYTVSRTSKPQPPEPPAPFIEPEFPALGSETKTMLVTTKTKPSLPDLEDTEPVISSTELEAQIEALLKKKADKTTSSEGVPIGETRDDNDSVGVSSEEDDEDDDDLGDDNGEEEFMLDDRKNERRVGEQTQPHHIQQKPSAGPNRRKKNRSPIKFFSTHPVSTGHIIARPRPYPLVMSPSPVLVDESEDWKPIGEKAHGLA